MAIPAAFLRWNMRVNAEDRDAAAAINEAIAAVRKLAPIIAKREAEHKAAVAEDRDSPWYPTEIAGGPDTLPAVDIAVAAIYDLSDAFASAYSADMPEPEET